MSRIVVLIETDHTDTDEAVRSVINSMKRAGYNYKDHGVNKLHVLPDGWNLALVMDGHVDVSEPEVDSANQH